jgi:phosphotransferase system enzyme I (PtsP)
LRTISRAAATAHVPVTLCGELAGTPLAAMALVGLGYRSLSMSAAAIGPVKAMALALDAGELQKALDALLDDGETVDGLPVALARFAETHGVPI